MAKSYLVPIIAGFCISSFLVLGHVMGLIVADRSIDVFDFYSTCIYENEYDYVNGDFSEFLADASWAGLGAAILLYAGIIASARTMAPLFVLLCIYIIIYVVWMVLLMYIFLFFSYVYLSDLRLQQSCGGLAEVRDIWWICFGAILMVLPASIGLCIVLCKKK
eukprot:158167_1